MLRTLVIDDLVRQRLHRLREFAEANPVSGARLVRIVEGVEPPPTIDDPRYRLELPGGWRIALSVEEQPAGPCMHLSVSVYPRDAETPLPGVEGVKAIAHELGFPAVTECMAWAECEIAVNILTACSSLRPL